MTNSTLAGRHIVVTGFTGFVAKVMVALILEQIPQIGRITLLVRPRGRLRPARRRVEEAIDQSPVFRRLRQRHGDHLAEWLGARIEPLDSDLEQPGCDLSADDRATLATADVIVHCAGLTDFSPDPLRALAANVAAAAHVADLAEDLQIPMVHVSTAYVAGCLGQVEVPETLQVGTSPNQTPLQVAAEIRRLQLACRRGEARTSVQVRVGLAADRAQSLGWPNIYTYTKGLAEQLLANRPGLDLTVVRPSIVECARRFPFPGWNEGLNTAGPLAWLISTAFRRLPTAPEHRFDVVPVDDVARGLAAITAAALRHEAGGVFHLSSSDHNPFTFDRAVELTGLGMRRWSRQHGDAVDRWILSQLDPVPVPPVATGPFAVERLRRWAPLARQALTDRGWLPPALADAVSPWMQRSANRLIAAEEQLERVETMLELFRPFIHDNDWTFRSDRVRRLTRDEGVFRFDLSDLCWRDYWVDVEYPGLRTWCIPLIEGGEVPADPPSVPRFRLQRAIDDNVRMASK